MNWFPSSPADSSSPTPFGVGEQPHLSPEEEVTIKKLEDNKLYERLAQTQAIGPSVRQQTQSEVLNLVLLYREIGSNPFSVRRLPFTIMRDMMADPDIGFAFYYIKNPLISAIWSIDSSDAMLASAVDAALRPINADTIEKFANSMGTGFSPLAKRFKIAKLYAKYRDKNSSEPNKELDAWDSKNVDPLLWDKMISLAPENCMPKWDEFGNFNGFMYSPVPIPNPLMVGVANIFGPQVLAGYPIPKEFAMWIVNEQNENYGSCFGQPRTRRAYRFWWSRWARWAWADRSYERKADPALLMYYPTDTEAGLDPNDPNNNSPTVHSLRDKAIQTGRNIRSGSVAAIPGEFMIGEDGKTLNQRKWEPKYLEGGENFSSLNENFSLLSECILRAMMLPTQAFVDSTVSGQTSSQRYIGAQMGQIYQESQLLLSEQYDNYINKYMIPQFVAANYPDKVDIPIKRVTRGYGKQDSETTKSLITLIGQKEPHRLPVDIRQLLTENGYALISEEQEKEEKKIREEESINSQPPVMSPSKKEGVQGYNVGVEKTETGENIYFQPGEELNLSVTSPGFLDRLPKIPPYEDPTVRSAAMKMRKLMVDRYKKQISSFSKQIRDRAVLKLAQEEKEAPEKPGLSSGAAKIAAAGAIAAWLAVQAVDFAPTLVALRELTSKILGAAGKKELKLANLDPSLFSPESQNKWIDDYVEENLKNIDHTVRMELEDFLRNQLEENSHPDVVAEAIEDHFSELPQTHADRVVRSQTREAYNKGVLQAAIDSGISQVLAHDASDGTDFKTDLICQQRNAKIMSPQQALKEEETTHPNCTLWFSYLNTESLSVKVTDDFPLHLGVTDRMPAAYDNDSETLYIRERAKDSQEIYVLSLGERLKLR